MAQIIAYLKFKNHCVEAMTFYQRCFGGDLTFQTVKGSVFETPGMDEEAGRRIVHSQLVGERFVLFGSEMVVPEEGANSTFLWINGEDDEEIRRIHRGLSEGGTVTAELQPAYWGTTFGAVTDRFGVKWYISKLPI
jgi:PhnB protein